MRDSFFKREASRRAYLLSTLLFFYLLAVIVCVPFCFLLPNPFVVVADSGLFLASLGSLLLNRVGKTLLAGWILVLSLELAVTLIIMTSGPLSERSTYLYDMYILVELLAVSLLPARSIFLLAGVNSLCMGFSVLSLIRAQDQSAHTLPMLALSIALQWVVAGVAYLWVKSMLKAVARADRAEMVAGLEHALAEQHQALEAGMVPILQTHVAVANGDLSARVPMHASGVLWQIARALNMLLVRFQRASLAEKELQRLEQAIAEAAQRIQLAEQERRLPRIPLTQTALDPLLVAIQGKTGTTGQMAASRPTGWGRSEQLPVPGESHEQAYRGSQALDPRSARLL